MASARDAQSRRRSAATLPSKTTGSSGLPGPLAGRLQQVKTREHAPQVDELLDPPMSTYAIERIDGRIDGEDWTDEYQELPGGAGVSLILESTSRAGVGPRLHQHPYAETFVIRRGSAVFTVGSEHLTAHAGQILVVPAFTPHKFSTGPEGYEAVHVHANVRFITEWLE